MKIQYLGFLPIAIIAGIVHINFIKDYLKYRSGQDYFLAFNPITTAFMIVIWIIISVLGVTWGISK